MIYAKIPASCIELFDKTIRDSYLASDGDIDREGIARDFGFEIGSTPRFSVLPKEPGYLYYHVASEPCDEQSDDSLAHVTA